MSSMLDSKDAFDLSSAHIRSRSASAAYTAWPCSNKINARTRHRRAFLVSHSCCRLERQQKKFHCYTIPESLFHDFKSLYESTCYQSLA